RPRRLARTTAARRPLTRPGRRLPRPRPRPPWPLSSRTPPPRRRRALPPRPPEPQPVPPTEAYRTRLLPVSGIGQGAPGRRSAARTPLGRQAGARRPVGRVHSVQLRATLRAAAHRLAGEAAGRKFFTRSADAAQDRI